MEQFEVFLNTYGVLAIFTLLLVKGAGVPIPIPTDAIMLLAAARAAEGRLSIPEAFGAILIASVIGGTIQFALIKAAGRRLLERFGRYLGLTPARLDAIADKMKNSNPFGIGVAILTPGVRSVTIPACSLAGVSLRSFMIGLAIGSTLFFLLHFVLGYAGRALLATLGIPLPVAIGLFVAVFALGLVVWVVIRRRKHPQATNGELIAEAFQCWHEATCPACLALGALNRLDSNLQLEHKH